MAKRIKIGDIVEISTSKGLAYAQYTHKLERYGALIRILDGIFDIKPDNFSELVQKKHKFVTFFPLGAAIRRGIFYVVGNEKIPKEAQEFPLFRAAGAIDNEGVVSNWWLWNGEEEWPIGQLPSEILGLPIRAIINDTALIEMIEENWTPETDYRTLKSLAKYGNS